MKEKTQNSSYGEHEQQTERKGRKGIKKKLVLIFLFLFFSLSMLLFLRLPCFDIREISINGLDKLSADEICAAAGLQEGMNIWKISTPEIREKVASLPRVAEVRVEKKLPGSIVIFVEEKQPVAMIPYHSSYLELAGDGLIIGICDEYKGELPLINGLSWGRMDVGMIIPDRPRGEIVEKFLEALAASPSLPLAEINVNNTQQIIVYTWEGMEVWLGNAEDLNEKLEVLQQLHRFFLAGENELQEGYLDIRAVEAPVFIPLHE
ncbi:MAG: FtsQ-type POTRA domain-containing protein [Firmicutes bacterium]|nr:FtsQ-type POTRA domain-containing protein [Bacillota bacterium]